MFKIPSKVRHFIGGEFVDSSREETFVNLNPATEEHLADVAIASRETVNQAVDAAEEGSRALAAMTLTERCNMLQRIGELVRKNHEDLAKLETLDTGKPLSETREGDIARTILNFEFFSSLARHQPITSYRTDDGTLHSVVREPVGICALITPWNLPLYLETWKLAPALAQGNAVILKPAELTPLSANALAEICLQAGVPRGAVNILHGLGENSTGQFICEHPEISAISFTGETTTGKAIMRTAASSLKKLSFELGGKGASVIFADADLTRAVPTSCRAAFRNQGQVCLAGSRLIVEEKALPAVLERLHAEIAKIVVGDPLDSKTTMGALISAEHRQKVLSYIQHAKDEALLKISCGGNIPANLKRGYFLEPTVILNPDQDSKLIQEEIFGPVVTIQTFKTADEALSMLNGTKFGLSCSIWTENSHTARKMAQGAKSGLVWVNNWFVRDLHAAFGGVKQSGIGREGGQYALEFFSSLKTISVTGSIV